MDSDSLQTAKAALRKAQRLIRKGRDPADCHRASEAITSRIVSELRTQNHLKVAAFMAIRGEVNLELLPRVLPEISWYLPKVVQRDGPLSFGLWNPKSLKSGAFGILEPGGELVDVHALDWVLFRALVSL